MREHGPPRSPIFHAPLADGDAVRELEQIWLWLLRELRPRELDLILRP